MDKKLLLLYAAKFVSHYLITQNRQQGKVVVIDVERAGNWSDKIKNETKRSIMSVVKSSATVH